MTPDPGKMVKFCQALFPDPELHRDNIANTESLTDSFKFEDDRLMAVRGWHFGLIDKQNVGPQLKAFYVLAGVVKGAFWLEVWHAIISADNKQILTRHPFYGDFLKPTLEKRVFTLFETMMRKFNQ